MLTEAKSTSAAANLLRVRNNQRRSRARRNEYVAELERKIQECETNGVPTRTIIPGETLRQLQEENRKLRELLEQAGVKRYAVNRYLREDDGNTIQETGQDTAGIVQKDVTSAAELKLPIWAPFMGDAGISDQTNFLPAVTTSLPDITDDLLAHSLPNLPSESFHSDDFGLFYDGTQEAPVFNTSDMFETTAVRPAPSLHTPASLWSPSRAPTDDLSIFCAQSSLPNTNQCDAESTLCSEAYEMLRQHNRRGWT